LSDGYHQALETRFPVRIPEVLETTHEKKAPVIFSPGAERKELIGLG
jgi:hypothetical protein